MRFVLRFTLGAARLTLPNTKAEKAYNKLREQAAEAGVWNATDDPDCVFLRNSCLATPLRHTRPFHFSQTHSMCRH
jgi:hypothetical protein